MKNLSYIAIFIALATPITAASQGLNQNINGTLKTVTYKNDTQSFNRNLQIWPETKNTYTELFPGKEFNPNFAFFGYIKQNYTDGTLEISINGTEKCDHGENSYSASFSYSVCAARIVLFADGKSVTKQIKLCMPFHIEDDEYKNFPPSKYKTEFTLDSKSMKISFQTKMNNIPINDCAQNISIDL